jgi:chemotaxis-related protein WspD
MASPLPPRIEQPDGEIDACWRRIGVGGDRSCPKLQEHLHCQNCEVFSAAATRLLDRAVPAEQIAEWTRHVARPKKQADGEVRSILVFRIGPEWLGLPTAVLHGIESPRPVHSLPHRRSATVLGVVNIRGELVVCVSLSHLLGLEAAAQPRRDLGQLVYPRLLVFQGEEGRIAAPVDEVYGIHRYPPGDLKPLPTTVARATATYSRGVLQHLDHSVGLLDQASVLSAVNRSLS